jgi:hypothetical protein
MTCHGTKTLADAADYYCYLVMEVEYEMLLVHESRHRHHHLLHDYASIPRRI